MSTNASSPAEPDLLALHQFAQDYGVMKCILVASICTQLYQYFTNIPSEISLIWRSPWKIGKVLYLLIRYPSLVFSVAFVTFWFGEGIPENRCFDIMTFIAWLGPLLFPPIQLLLVLRTTALWGREQFAIYTLPLALLFMDIMALVLNYFITKSFRVASHLQMDFPGLDEVYGCPSIVMFYPNRHLLLCQVGALVFDIVVMAFTAVSFVGQRVSSRSRFLSTFYRDGMIYCSIMSLSCLANIVLYFQPQDRFVLRQWALPLFCVTPTLACQMIINTKREAMKSDVHIFYHHGSLDVGSSQSRAHSANPIEFARRSLVSQSSIAA